MRDARGQVVGLDVLAKPDVEPGDWDEHRPAGDDTEGPVRAGTVAPGTVPTSRTARTPASTWRAALAAIWSGGSSAGSRPSIAIIQMDVGVHKTGRDVHAVDAG